MNLPIWLQQLIADLERHEGFRGYAYPDPLSKLGKRKDISWGYAPGDVLLAKYGLSEKDGRPWTVGFGFTKGVTPATKIPLSLAQEKFLPVILEHLRDIYKLVPKFDDMPDYVKAILGNLIYNMGYETLKTFVNTLRFFNARDFKQAAANLKQSKWYRQVGDRGEELVERLKTGIIDPRYKIKEN